MTLVARAVAAATAQKEEARQNAVRRGQKLVEWLNATLSVPLDAMCINDGTGEVTAEGVTFTCNATLKGWPQSEGWQVELAYALLTCGNCRCSYHHRVGSLLHLGEGLADPLCDRCISLRANAADHPFIGPDVILLDAAQGGESSPTCELAALGLLLNDRLKEVGAALLWIARELGR